MEEEEGVGGLFTSPHDDIQRERQCTLRCTCCLMSSSSLVPGAISARVHALRTPSLPSSSMHHASLSRPTMREALLSILGTMRGRCLPSWIRFFKFDDALRGKKGNIPRGRSVFGSIVALEKGIIKEEVVRIDRWVDVVGLSRVDNWW